MTGRSLTKMLKYEASKKKEIAELVENIASLTDQDIETAKVPLPWYRQALYALRNEVNESTLVMSLMASLNNCIVDGVVNDPMGTILVWVGPDTFLRIDRSNEVEVKTGELLFLVNDGVWIETIFSKLVDPRILTETKFVEQSRKSEYRVAFRNKVNRTIFTEPPTNPNNTLQQYGVRFSK